MINTSPDSVRVFAIMVLAMVWFYIFNQWLRERND